MYSLNELSDYLEHNIVCELYIHNKRITICLSDIDECVPNPCQNGGVCSDGINSFTCECATGFVGVTCETSKIR